MHGKTALAPSFDTKSGQTGMQADMQASALSVSVFQSDLVRVISRGRINTPVERSAKNDNILLKTHTLSKITYLQEERATLNASSLGQTLPNLSFQVSN